MSGGAGLCKWAPLFIGRRLACARVPDAHAWRVGFVGSSLMFQCRIAIVLPITFNVPPAPHHFTGFRASGVVLGLPSRARLTVF